MSSPCDEKMSYEECELAILRMQVDKAQNKMSKRLVQSSETNKILNIVANFIKKKKLVCYGGIAINALLPKKDKIYNKDIDLPDYDFFSSNAVDDAKALADEFYKKGFTEVEAKAAQHHNTFKVYVNFMAVADITYLPKSLFDTIRKTAVKIDGIMYTDANFLKMGMYLELSRPSGDTDRWEKVMKRLALINKHYPIDSKDCDKIKFQRNIDDKKVSEEIYNQVKDILIKEKVVFFGGYALANYKQYLPSKVKKQVEEIPDFDVISNDPLAVAKKIESELGEKDFDVEIFKNDPVGEIIPVHYEVKVDGETIAFIYKSVACHSYNVIMESGHSVRIATIDTILTFYFAFLYADRPYYDKTRLLCMADLLFKVQEENRLEQKGLLRRFSIICLGKQPSRMDMREEKSKMHKELKPGTKEYDEWFLNYRPGQNKKKGKTKKKSKSVKKKTKKRKLKKPKK